MEDVLNHVVGISIGTYTMEAYIWKNGSIVHVPLNGVNGMFPSCVFVESDGILTGQQAWFQEKEKPEQLIKHVKRIIGLKYDPIRLDHILNLSVYDLVAGEGQYINCKIIHDNPESLISSVDVTVCILHDIRECVIGFAGHVILTAYISVTASFINDQCVAAITAALAASFVMFVSLLNLLQPRLNTPSNLH